MVASLVAIALHNSTGHSDLENECPPGQVKSRDVNSDRIALGECRDIGYTLFGKACSSKRPASCCNVGPPWSPMPDRAMRCCKA
jgi:hypothetical protein